MSKKAIKDALRDYILENFLHGEPPESLTSEVKLISDGVLDSLASLKLVAFIEERFGARIEAHEVDAEHLDNIDSIVDMIETRTA